MLLERFREIKGFGRRHRLKHGPDTDFSDIHRERLLLRVRQVQLGLNLRWNVIDCKEKRGMPADLCACAGRYSSFGRTLSVKASNVA
jgi:hypothetical protein